MVVKLSPIERLVLCCCDMEGAAVMTKADFAKCRDDTTKLSSSFRPFNMVAYLAFNIGYIHNSARHSDITGGVWLAPLWNSVFMS